MHQASFIGPQTRTCGLPSTTGGVHSFGRTRGGDAGDRHLAVYALRVARRQRLTDRSTNRGPVGELMARIDGLAAAQRPLFEWGDAGQDRVALGTTRCYGCAGS